jgi:hypothetical protein
MTNPSVSAVQKSVVLHDERIRIRIPEINEAAIVNPVGTAIAGFDAVPHNQNNPVSSSLQGSAAKSDERTTFHNYPQIDLRQLKRLTDTLCPVLRIANPSESKVLESNIRKEGKDGTSVGACGIRCHCDERSVARTICGSYGYGDTHIHSALIGIPGTPLQN